MLNASIFSIKIEGKTFAKGGLISKGIWTLIPFLTKGAKLLTWAENLDKLFILERPQGSDLSLFVVSNGNKVKIPSEIKPPLPKLLVALGLRLCYLCKIAFNFRENNIPEHFFGKSVSSILGSKIIYIIYMPLFLVDSESGRCSWHHVPNLNFHLKRLNNGLQENSEAETTDDETASPRTRRRRNRR